MATIQELVQEIDAKIKTLQSQLNRSRRNKNKLLALQQTISNAEHEIKRLEAEKALIKGKDAQVIILRLSDDSCVTNYTVTSEMLSALLRQIDRDINENKTEIERALCDSQNTCLKIFESDREEYYIKGGN